jgi:hypothetical protein
VAAVALHQPRRRGRRVGRGEDDDAAAPCAPKALARALYVFLFSMYYISNEKKLNFFCVGPLGAPHDPSGQNRTGYPRIDPYGPNRTDSVSKMDRPAGDALMPSGMKGI